METLILTVEIIVVLALIVLACIVFTNAVEHLGEELNLSEGAVGSVLAAVGTALPETIVPLVAIIGAYLTGGDLHAGEEIGIGAILGAPFLLGTLAFFVTGAAVYFFARAGRRDTNMPINSVIMLRDMHYFALAYGIAVLSSFIPFKPVKYAIAAFLLVIYLIYVVKTIRTASKEPEGGHEELEALYFTNFVKMSKKYRLLAVLVQLFIALAGIIVLAHIFVEHIKHLSDIFNINPLILSLIVAPIATELPEKFNSILWVSNRKDTLAMGNITGAMVFQSCIPVAVGLCLTPWVLSVDAWVNVITVFLSVGVVYGSIVSNKGILKPSALLMGGVFYLLFLAYIGFKLF